MSATQEQQLVEANKKYANHFNSPNLPVSPSKNVAIDPAAAYGLGPGDGIVVRNAGASARDAARSVLLASHLLGVEDIFVIKHTRCGLLGATTEMVHSAMKKNLGVTESHEVDKLEVLPIADLEQSAEDDAAFLRGHPLKPKATRITGWIYDTDTGLVKKVVE